MSQNSETENVTKLKNSKCGKTQKFKMWPNSKTQMGQHSKILMWQNPKTKNVKKLKKIKMWQNSKKIVTKVIRLDYERRKKLRNWNCDKTQ